MRTVGQVGAQALDYTALMAQVRHNIDRSNGLLEHTRLVAAMGSRMALSLFISATRPGGQLVGAATTESEALQLLDRHEADLLLCTDRLEQGNGGSLVSAARRRSSPPRTLMIVTQPRRVMVIRTALQAGCDGLCLEANIGMGTVLQALTCVEGGATYLDRELRQHYLEALPDLNGRALTPLTLREQQVLELLTCGLNNQQIGRRLYIGPETVKSHVQRILEKLQANDRTHAAIQGIRLGLVDWPEPG